MKKLESSVEKSFIRACKRLGVFQIKIGVNALPDRIALLPGGKFVWVELKRPGEEPRPNQKRKHKLLRRLGHTVWIIDTSEQAREAAKRLSEKDCKTGH